MLDRTVKEAIAKADSDDIKEVFRLAKIRHGQIQEFKTAEYDIGDSVHFDTKKRGRIDGIIEKVNRKTVSVRATNGVIWSVSPGLLKRSK